MKIIGAKACRFRLLDEEWHDSAHAQHYGSARNRNKGPVTKDDWLSEPPFWRKPLFINDMRSTTASITRSHADGGLAAS